MLSSSHRWRESLVGMLHCWWLFTWEYHWCRLQWRCYRRIPPLKNISFKMKINIWAKLVERHQNIFFPHPKKIEVRISFFQKRKGWNLKNHSRALKNVGKCLFLVDWRALQNHSKVAKEEKASTMVRLGRRIFSGRWDINSLLLLTMVEVEGARVKLKLSKS